MYRAIFFLSKLPLKGSDWPVKIRVFSDFTFYNWLKVSEIFYQIIVLIEASNFRLDILVQSRTDRASQATKIAESVRVSFNPLGMNLSRKIFT